VHLRYKTGLLIPKIMFRQADNAVTLESRPCGRCQTASWLWRRGFVM